MADSLIDIIYDPVKTNIFVTNLLKVNPLQDNANNSNKSPSELRFIELVQCRGGLYALPLWHTKRSHENRKDPDVNFSIHFNLIKNGSTNKRGSTGFQNH